VNPITKAVFEEDQKLWSELDRKTGYNPYTPSKSQRENARKRVKILNFQRTWKKFLKKRKDAR
jgi:predicted nucleotidyltransferase